MKVLLDHNLDWRLAKSLPDHEVQTTFEMSWSTLKNGALLTAAEQSGFSVLLSGDKGIKSQQNLQGRSIAVIIIRSPNNRLATHLEVVPELLRLLQTIGPGEVHEVFHPKSK